MPAEIHWELHGNYHGKFTADAGGFVAAIKDVGRQGSIAWLHTVTPILRDEAKRLCPVKTGALRDSIEDRYDDGNLRSFYGSDMHYAIFQEVGFHMRNGQWFEGRHYLVGAINRLRTGLI